MPLRTPDFAPVLQKAADAKPDALFVFVPSGAGAQFVKQFVERGLDKSGHQADRHRRRHRRRPAERHGRRGGRRDQRAQLLGRRTTAPANKAFVEAFKKANGGMRPNFMAVGGYDGMHLIYEALKKTNGDDRRREADRGDEGHGLGEPARPDLDRSRDARHRAEHLHPQGREEGRRALQRRVRDHPERQGPGEGRGKK